MSVKYLKNFPKELDRKKAFLIFDQVLLNQHSQWIRTFPRRLKVKSGESLKGIDSFSNQIEDILRRTQDIPREQLVFVAFGGGSVGDFVGFIASILKRGVGLIHVPSTWLSAMDSAHGGKTALNVAGIKNQIGTFYPAKEVYLVKEVLSQVPSQQVSYALGEFYKMALIAGGKLYLKALKKTSPSKEFLWACLPEVVEAKMKIVKKDPLERKGIRTVLNLGHTIGHVLEAELGLPHGEAVRYGLLFSLEFGSQRGMQSPEAVAHWLPTRRELSQTLNQVPSPRKKLAGDKKIVGSDSIQFVFIKKPGQAVVAEVGLSELLKEWERQKGLTP